MQRMTTASKCIFCDSKLTSDTKPEHILLNALGGRKTTRHVICSTCNNDFGGTIDDALTEQVEVLRNLLQFESGTGKPPPMLKNLQAGSERVNIGNDGRPKIVKPPFTVIDLPDGTAKVEIHAQTPEAIKKMLPHLAARLRISEADLTKQIMEGNAALVEARPGQKHHGISLGGEKALRAVAKSFLVLLATVVGNNAVKANPFATSRDFVVKGSEEFSKTRAQIDSRDVPGLDEFKKDFGPFFNLIYIRSNEVGRVVGHFTLYNVISWQIALAEMGGPPSQKIALVSNPVHPVVWSDDASILPDIPFEWLDAAERPYELERARQRLIKMIEYHTDNARETEVGRICDDVFDRHAIKGEQPVSDPAVKNAIFNEIAARLGAHALSLGHQEPLKPEDIEKLLRGEKLR